MGFRLTSVHIGGIDYHDLLSKGVKDTIKPVVHDGKVSWSMGCISIQADASLFVIYGIYGISTANLAAIPSTLDPKYESR